MQNNNNNNQGGRGGAAARGRGRGAQAPRGERPQAAQQPLAAQVRQMQRLSEPDEVTVLKRFANTVGAIRIRSEYAVSGLVSREIGILSDAGTMEWISIADAELRLAVTERNRQLESYTARIPVRLAGIDPLPVDYAHCNDEQKGILRMSQAQYGAFRARENGQAA
jgi:hypothetical protein